MVHISPRFLTLGLNNNVWICLMKLRNFAHTTLRHEESFKKSSSSWPKRYNFSIQNGKCMLDVVANSTYFWWTAAFFFVSRSRIFSKLQ